MGKFGAWKRARRRSGFEDRIEDELKRQKLKYEYEPDTFKYVLPETKHNYTPDFKLRDKVYIEAKGEFTAADRKKMLAVREQHPDVTIYLLFQRSDNTLSKTSKTTYAAWADKNGFIWADYDEHNIPKEWTK